MTKSSTDITLTWRDENYGGLNSAAALRSYVDDDRATKTKDSHRILRSHGFEFNDSRGSWIAKRIGEDTLLNMVVAFEEKGFSVEHAGAIPNVFAQNSSPKP